MIAPTLTPIIIFLVSVSRVSDWVVTGGWIITGGCVPAGDCVPAGGCVPAGDCVPAGSGVVVNTHTSVDTAAITKHPQNSLIRNLVLTVVTDVIFPTRLEIYRYMVYMRITMTAQVTKEMAYRRNLGAFYLVLSLGLLALAVYEANDSGWTSVFWIVFVVIDAIWVIAELYMFSQKGLAGIEF